MNKDWKKEAESSLLITGVSLIAAWIFLSISVAFIMGLGSGFAVLALGCFVMGYRMKALAQVELEKAKEQEEKKGEGIERIVRHSHISNMTEAAHELSNLLLSRLDDAQIEVGWDEQEGWFFTDEDIRVRLGTTFDEAVNTIKYNTF